MNPSINFSNYINIPLKEVDHLLIDEKSKENLLRFSEKFPWIFSRSLCCFERDLQSESGEADFGIMFTKEESEKSAFNNILKTAQIQNYIKKNDLWSRIENLNKELLSKNSSLNKFIQLVFFEFDSTVFSQEIPVPIIFIGNEKGLPEKISEKEPEKTNRIIALSDGIIEINKNTNKIGLLNDLMKINSLLIGKEYISQAGILTSRDINVFRFIIKHITPERIPKFLADMNWKGSIPGLESFLRKFCSKFDYYSLNIDFDGKIGNKIGIECCFIKNAQPQKEKRWFEIMDKLVYNEMCSSEISSAILNFPKTVKVNAYDILEYRLDPAPDFYSQGLNHLKYVFQDNYKSKAKIYFWYGFTWK